MFYGGGRPAGTAGACVAQTMSYAYLQEVSIEDIPLCVLEFEESMCASKLVSSVTVYNDSFIVASQFSWHIPLSDVRVITYPSSYGAAKCRLQNICIT